MYIYIYACVCGVLFPLEWMLLWMFLDLYPFSDGMFSFFIHQLIHKQTAGLAGFTSRGFDEVSKSHENWMGSTSLKLTKKAKKGPCATHHIWGQHGFFHEKTSVPPRNPPSVGKWWISIGDLSPRSVPALAVLLHLWRSSPCKRWSRRSWGKNWKTWDLPFSA